MSAITVQVNQQAPDTFQVSVAQLSGASYRLPRDHEDVLEIEELAYGRLLSGAVRPLPAGTICVQITEEQSGGRPTNEEVADHVARVLAERDGGWSTWL